MGVSFVLGFVTNSLDFGIFKEFFRFCNTKAQNLNTKSENFDW